MSATASKGGWDQEGGREGENGREQGGIEVKDGREVETGREVQDSRDVEDSKEVDDGRALDGLGVEEERELGGRQAEDGREGEGGMEPFPLLSLSLPLSRHGMNVAPSPAWPGSHTTSGSTSCSTTAPWCTGAGPAGLPDRVVQCSTCTTVQSLPPREPRLGTQF